MVRTLTPEQRAMVEQNMTLVTFTIKKYLSNLTLPALVSDDDIYQEGCIGLCKAVLNFDAAHNTAFSTYAVKCILSQIITTYKRKLKKDINQAFVSIVVNDQGDTTDIFDTIPAHDNNVEDAVLARIALTEIGRSLNKQQKLAVYYLASGLTQTQTAAKIRVSQTTISRYCSKIRESISF